jgi:hypothetical protein
LNRFEGWMLHISTFLLAVTGLVYAYMRYILKPSDPFAVINHPLQPHMLNWHIIAAPILVLAVGMITHAHIVWKIQIQTRIARRSGIFLIPLFVIMTFSGYLLQVISSDLRRVVMIVHLATGGLWFILYVAHHIASLAYRRSMSSPQGISRT